MEAYPDGWQSEMFVKFSLNNVKGLTSFYLLLLVCQHCCCHQAKMYNLIKCLWDLQQKEHLSLDLNKMLK